MNKAIIGKPIRIGYVGEDDYRQVVFDLEELGLTEYGLGTVTIAYTRPGATSPYPIAPTVTGTTAVWTVTATDVQTNGYGEIQIRNSISGKVGKTVIFEVIVKRSLGSEVTPPDPYQTWFDKIMEATTKYPQIDETTSTWLVWNPITEEWDDTEVEATGADGISPAITSYKSGKKTSLYITDATHPSPTLLAEIMDGEDGTGAVQSVNGKVGNVVLDYEDVHALSEDTELFSGDYNDLTNKPTIPTKTSQLQNDSGFLTEHQSLSAYRTSAAQDVIDATKANTSDLATVATSGSYTDLSNKPTIPTVPTNVSAFVNDAGYLTQHQSLSAYRTASAQDTIDAGKVNEPTTEGTDGQVLATDGEGGRRWITVQGGGGEPVAYIKSASVNGDTLTLVKKDDTTVTYTPDIPTKTSELQNDSGFLTEHQSLAAYRTSSAQDVIDATKANTADLSTVATSGSYNDLSNKPTIPVVPTNVSAFTNDAGYLTQHQSLSAYRTSADQDVIDSGKQATLTAGANINITGTTISATDTTYSDATTSVHGLMSTTDKTKLDGIASGAEVNVQADWNEADTTSDAYIQNKPTIPVVPTNVSAFTNDAGYLTEHQSLSAYRTSADQDVIDATKADADDLTLYIKIDSATAADALTLCDTYAGTRPIVAWRNQGTNRKEYLLSIADTTYHSYVFIMNWQNSCEKQTLSASGWSYAFYSLVESSTFTAHTGNTDVHVTASEKSTWDAKGTYSKPSGGIPATDLASTVQTALGQAHTHSNKALLDTYTQTEANLSNAVTSAHNHSNKQLLDGISSSDVSNWNGKSVVSVGASGTATDEVGYITVNGVEKKLAGGFSPQIVVTAPTGSTVTCTKGSTVLTATEVSGTWTFNVTEYGTWTIDASLGSLSSSATVDVTKVEQYTADIKYYRIYGISKAYTDGGTAWTRTDDAVGMSATASVGTSGYYSDFDNAYPWSQMKRETLSTGDVMVKIPKFWFKRYRDGNNEYIKIADTELDGFTLHPLFNYSDYVYVGAYETVSGHYSKNGYAPLVSQTRAQFRSGARAKGSGWSQYDLACHNAIQMLYLVEFADNDSQSKVGRGWCDSHSAAIGNNGGSDVLYTANCYSGRPTGTDGSTVVMYRGIENPWGNIWKWVDGLNWNGGTYYVCTNPSNYADDTATNYTSLSYTGATNWSQSYITQNGLDTSNPWAIMPNAVGSSASTYTCDACWSLTGWRVFYCGGCWNNGSIDGIFAVDVNDASSYSYTHIGGRLLYRPV